MNPFKGKPYRVKGGAIMSAGTDTAGAVFSGSIIHLWCMHCGTLIDAALTKDELLKTEKQCPKCAEKDEGPLLW